MNRPTFDQTVGVLVKAYLNDELAHKLCCACAVGNLVAYAIGTKPKRIDDPNSHVEFENSQYENGASAMAWYDSLGSSPTTYGISQIEATGYTCDELLAIEHAFETAPGEPTMHPGMYRGKCTDVTWMFNGLMAVVDVLASIHSVDLSIKEEAKKLFVKI